MSLDRANAAMAAAITASQGETHPELRLVFGGDWDTRPRAALRFSLQDLKTEDIVTFEHLLIR